MTKERPATPAERRLVEDLWTGFLYESGSDWIAYRCNVSESDAHRDERLVWIRNRDAVAAVLHERERAKGKR